LPATLVLGALAFLSVRAHAAEPEEVTISAPAVKTVGRAEIGAPIEETTVIARVATDPATLTSHSGVALLKDKVLEAARKACTEAGPLNDDDGTCVRDAVDSAKPQIEAAIARARTSANG
jgi:UrcA family protein